jgi:hypothetical protein
MQQPQLTTSADITEVSGDYGRLWVLLPDGFSAGGSVPSGRFAGVAFPVWWMGIWYWW